MVFTLERIEFGRVIQDIDSYQHWSPTSEQYTAADVLLWYLVQGWNLDRFVTIQNYCLSGHRYSSICHFTLRCKDVSITIPVLANPVVRRIIREYGLVVMENQNSTSTLGYLAQDTKPS